MRALRVFGAIFILFIGWKFYRVGYQYGVAAWNSTRAFSFLKDWLPAVVGVAVGVIPGSEWERKMKFRYRVIIVIVGFVYSGVLYHAETLADTENTKQLGEAVGSAVTQANNHSDEQFNKVTQRVSSVDGKVDGIGKQLDGTTTTISQNLAKVTDSLGADISKVGKPDPPVPAELRFSLWDPTATLDNPVLVQTISHDANGNFPVDFSFSNVSPTTAESIKSTITLRIHPNTNRGGQC